MAIAQITKEMIERHFRWNEKKNSEDMQLHYNGEFSIAQRVAVTAHF